MADLRHPENALGLTKKRASAARDPMPPPVTARQVAERDHGKCFGAPQ